MSFVRFEGEAKRAPDPGRDCFLGWERKEPGSAQARAVEEASGLCPQQSSFPPAAISVRWLAWVSNFPRTLTFYRDWELAEKPYPDPQVFGTNS